MLHGIDISHWQRSINISNINCDFIIIKATQGYNHVDDCFKNFTDTALRTGKKIGLYHYFDDTAEPETQAIFFVNTVQKYIGKAILVLDWEKYGNSFFSLGQEIAIIFLDKVYELTGVRPLIYMSKSVTRDYKWDKVVSKSYGLWVAQYKNRKKVNGFLSTPWTDNKGIGDFKLTAIFQYTSNGHINGYKGNLDLDIAYMTKNAWDKYAKSSISNIN